MFRCARRDDTHVEGRHPERRRNIPRSERPEPASLVGIHCSGTSHAGAFLDFTERPRLQISKCRSPAIQRKRKANTCSQSVMTTTATKILTTPLRRCLWQAHSRYSPKADRLLAGELHR